MLPAKGCTLLLAFLVLSVMIGGCASSAPKPTPTPAPVKETTLTISGSGSVLALLTAAEAAFETDTPGYNLNIISGSGTSGAIKGVLDGTLDLAAMARAPKEEETKNGLQYTQFGGTGVAVIVHPNVSVDNLTQEQVKSIFMGETDNWSAVGGADLKIVVYVRDEDESATGRLRKVIVGNDPFPETVAGVLTSVGDMLTAVQGAPGSIGFATWTGVATSDKNVKAVTLDGMKPDDAKYAVILPLGIGYAEGRQDAAKPFIDWLLSDKGQTQLHQLGVIGAE